jgi:hypothetical protein
MIDACPEASSRIPQALKICQIVTLNNEAKIRGFHCSAGTLNFCREIKPAKKINKAAVGAIRPRYVQGGISFRPIFRNGHEVPQPIIMMIRIMYPDLVRLFPSIYFKIITKKPAF